jgi:hypothetical protein
VATDGQAQRTAQSPPCPPSAMATCARQ